MVAWNAFDVTAFPSIFPVAIAEASLYSNGDIVPSPITVIYNTPEHMIYPQQVDLAFLPGGGTNNWGQYVWVWKQVKPGTADYDIWAGNIDAYLGGVVPALPPRPVEVSEYEQSAPRLASSGGTHFMVVWQERSSDSPYDWDVRGREMNQIGTLFGDVQVIAGQGSTDETDPFIAAWPGPTPRYAVGDERQSETGSGIWLSYFNNGANTLSFSGYTFWLDYFPVADLGFWTNSYAAGSVGSPYVIVSYGGKSNTPGDHWQIYSRSWAPYLSRLPVALRQ